MCGIGHNGRIGVWWRMAKIPVYQFEYFDRESRTFIVANDLATEAAIKSFGGVVLRATAQVVDESAVAAVSGIVRRHHG